MWHNLNISHKGRQTQTTVEMIFSLPGQCYFFSYLYSYLHKKILDEQLLSQVRLFFLKVSLVPINLDFWFVL